tara:strand:- start:6496 stop:7854 length:1359 start_codon:yes stop_codon:yes gene_type:complete
MIFLRFAFTSFSCLLLTACLHLSNQDTSSPVELPETFSAKGTNPTQSKWWLDLKDEPLNQLIQGALESNLELKSIWQRLQQSRALLTQIKADIYPALDGEVSTSNTEANNNILETRNTSLGLAASYEIDLWGRIQATAEAQNLEALASEAAFKAASITLSAEVANTWYRYVEQKAQIVLLSKQLANNQQTLDFIEFRFKQGKVNATDVLQQRQLVENRRGEIISAKSSAAVLAHSLAVLRGVSPGNLDLANVHKFKTLPPLPATGVPSEFIQNRPDIQQSLLRVKAADQRVAAALANQYPRLTLSANIRTSNETLGGVFEQWLGSIAANLIAPLFDAGSRKAAVKQQQALLQERINDYGQNILNAMQEVENALQQESHQRRLIANLDERLTLSTQIIQRIKDNYNNGAEDYLSVLSAELSDQELQRSRLAAQRQIIEFRIALYRALARGWQD